MSDEKKVNAETTEVQPPEGAPAPKKRVWPIVMSAFAVIVIAVLVGFLHWHEEPSFCSTICHEVMYPYVDGYYSEDPALSAADHEAAGVTCLGCHWSQAKLLDLVNEVVMFVSDSFTDPLPDMSEEFVNDEFCGTCHDGTTAPTKESATEGWTYDPHNIPEGIAGHDGQNFTCGSCHSVHKQSRLVCAECHVGFTADLSEEDQAALANWAIPEPVDSIDVPAAAEAFGIYDPHAGDAYVQFSSMHETAGSDGGTITCADCHDTKTIVCAECHEDVFTEDNLPEGWTLGVSEAKAATADMYGIFDPHAGDAYVQFSPMHETAGSDGGTITCADCHDTKTIKCAQCHLNTFEGNVPEGWSLPEGAMDVSAMATTTDDAATDEGAADDASSDAAAVDMSTVSDGTYEGTGKGIGGDVPVTVTVEGGTITSVEVGDNSETQGIGSNAIEQLPDAIVAANGTEGVDAVSGATVTSNAIFDAVNAALASATA